MPISKCAVPLYPMMFDNKLICEMSIRFGYKSWREALRQASVSNKVPKWFLKGKEKGKSFVPEVKMKGSRAAKLDLKWTNLDYCLKLGRFSS